MSPATVDRYLFKRSLASAALILGLVVVLMLGLEALMSMRWYLKGDLPEGTSRLWLICQLLAMRVPQILSPLLPIAAVGGVLMAIAPMLRKGELTALAAGGVSLRRACRSALLLAISIGVLDFALSDQVAPRLETQREALEDLLQGSFQHGATWHEADSGADWYAERVQLSRSGELTISDVIIATADGRLVTAGQLTHTSAGWQLEPPIVFSAGGEQPQLERSTEALPCTGPLAVNAKPDELASDLLSRHARTSLELLSRGSRLELSLVWQRLVRLVIPLLCLCCALPIFVRFSNRNRLLIGAAQALLMAAVPMIIMAVGTIAADTSPWPLPVVAALSLALALAPGAALMLRWRD
ncbi:MAG: LptF/LptG family permease [Planctomycetota bacterium]|jgi:lipopolysaccharide export LptBFGC system permease protein LptF|nr:LptF/LptG family permease [Planctomycetota bacterium]